MSLAANPPTVESTKVNLVRIAHVYYTHVDLLRQHQFLTDFGFTEVSRLNVGKSNETIYYRGYGSEPFLYCLTKGEEDAFGGAAFVVESRKDLELATQVIPTASKIWEMKHAPGGGECVTVKDPVDGITIHLVYGQVQRQMEEQHEQRAFNFVSSLLIWKYWRETVTDHGIILQPTEKHRSVNRFQRMQKGQQHPQTHPSIFLPLTNTFQAPLKSTNSVTSAGVSPTFPNLSNSGPATSTSNRQTYCTTPRAMT